MLERLKTQDKVQAWEKNSKIPSLCVLCSQVEESHKHLFFEGDFSKGLWDKTQGLARMTTIPAVWDEVIKYIRGHISRKSIWSNIERIVLCAVLYYIWHERNLRMFKKCHRTVA